MDSPFQFQRPQRFQRFLYWLLFGAGFVLALVALPFLFSSAQVNQFKEVHLKTLSNIYPFRKQQAQPKWLLATISPAHSQRRRNVIRATWQKMFIDSDFETRFVISNPTKLWQPLIDHENGTYGDLIILPHLEESAHVANTIKSMEFIKKISNEGRSWNFVSKIDDDSFVDAKAMYRDFLRAQIEEEEQTLEHHRTVVARRLTISRNDQSFPYPGGQFYTLSWEVVRCLGRLYAENPINDEFEDVLVGRLLHENNVPFNFVVLNDTRSFDTQADLHQVGEMAINPHKMKDDEMYLQVASMYNSDGYKGE